ncbi:gas vesicle protein [Methylohalobius crimeensis]|uniref:gas vesicle protein n=1 Tax=Methylohalobius crimeensis TaxID=244365 RepID=UPI0003B5BA3E|nr:gas vesicle protein [Methylohalobius crimeensis]
MTNKTIPTTSADTIASAQVRQGLEQGSLCGALDRLLSTGVVVAGDATLTVADIDLLRLQFQLVLSSAARQEDSA